MALAVASVPEEALIQSNQAMGVLMLGLYGGLRLFFQFYQRNGRPYPISNGDGVVIEITQGIHKVRRLV